MELDANITAMPDEQVAVIAAKGDKKAFDALVERYYPRLMCFLHRRSTNRSDVEDIIQDTFLKAYLNIASYNPEHKFACWLFTIASRTAANSSRDKKNNCNLRIEIASKISSPEDKAISDEENESLWHFAEKLESKQYSALYLRYYEDLAIEDIARILKVSKVNVRVLLHRARNNLIKLTENNLTGEEK